MMNSLEKRVVYIACYLGAVLLGAAASPGAKAFQTSKEAAETAKNEMDVRIYKATGDLLVLQKEAEARQAIATAEKLALQAKLPAVESKALAGSINSEKFNGAAQARAFDLAQKIAGDLCKKLPGKFSFYDETTIKQIVNAKAAEAGLAKMTAKMILQSTVLDKTIADGGKTRSPSNGEKESVLLGIGAATTGIKALADFASLMKTNIQVASVDYGTDTRPMFISAMAASCPEKIVGLGAGYLGEFDTAVLARLNTQIDEVSEARAKLADKVQTLQKLYEKSKDQIAKDQVATLVAANAALIKSSDTFLTSLVTGESGPLGSLNNVARYLAYATRVEQHQVLEFNLRLEGMSITKENLFTGQHVRLSGVAFLWYRLYQPNGELVLAGSERRISKPEQVDLRGASVDSSFWNDR